MSGAKTSSCSKFLWGAGFSLLQVWWFVFPPRRWSWLVVCGAWFVGLRARLVSRLLEGPLFLATAFAAALLATASSAASFSPRFVGFSWVWFLGAFFLALASPALRRFALAAVLRLVRRHMSSAAGQLARGP